MAWSGAWPTRRSSAAWSTALVGGATGAVRAANAAVRTVQTGYLRYYAALLLVGLTGLGLYFLMAGYDPPLDPMALLSPRRCSACLAPSGPRHGSRRSSAARSCRSATRSLLVFDFDAGARAAARRRRAWIPDLGVHYRLGVDGLNLFLVLLTAVAGSRRRRWSAIRTPERATLLPAARHRRDGVLGAFLAQDLLLFVLFFDLMLMPFYFLFGIWGCGPRWERISPRRRSRWSSTRSSARC